MLFGLLLLIFGVAVCLLAFVKGRLPERVAAAIILANFVTATASYSVGHSMLIDLMIDGITAMALLPLTIHYASFWLGAVMLIYATQFGMDAFYLVLEQRPGPWHSTINNANSFAINLALAWGVVTGWTRRRSGGTPVEHMAPAQA